MDLTELLKHKLKHDLLNELSELSELSDHLTKLSNKIDEKVLENIVTIDVSVLTNQSTETQCHARIMGPRYADLRCHYKCRTNKDYCMNHEKRIDNQGYLAFGRYDEPRPVINEKGNKIPWRDTTAMDDINTIIQYQNMKLNKLIKIN